MAGEFYFRKFGKKIEYCKHIFCSAETGIEEQLGLRETICKRISLRYIYTCMFMQI